jgi:LmbE family N-acetylglucosaminyl deacetylase
MKLLVIGAHPDDSEYRAGGTAKKLTDAGHEVKFVSMTNGDAGHHLIHGPELAQRRAAEAGAAAKIAGAQSQILEHKDARLEPSQKIRDQLIGLIRQFHPDLIVTHRPWDYHPDHRYTSQLVLDASYLLTVPAICPDVPYLHNMPVITYMEDSFVKPVPFEPDIAVSIDDCIDDKMEMLHCHKSQFYEWLPHNNLMKLPMPSDENQRKAWLIEQMKALASETAQKFRPLLKKLYGDEQGESVKYAEAFELSEYGQTPDAQNLRKLFSVIPNG